LQSSGRKRSNPLHFWSEKSAGKRTARNFEDSPPKFAAPEFTPRRFAMKMRSLLTFRFSRIACVRPNHNLRSTWRCRHVGQKVLVYRTEMGHGEMGKWWQKLRYREELQLNESQITQLDQIFYDHRLKLIDFGAEMEKQDLRLQTLLDADVPDEGQISSQVDQVLDARGKLEREATTMNLDLRKVLPWRSGGSSSPSVDRRVVLAIGSFFRKDIPPPGGADVLRYRPQARKTRFRHLPGLRRFRATTLSIDLVH